MTTKKRNTRPVRSRRDEFKVKYCLHPGNRRVQVYLSGNPVWAMEYNNAVDIVDSYGVKMEECIVWDAKKHRGTSVENLEHLHPKKYVMMDDPTLADPSEEIIEEEENQL